MSAIANGIPLEECRVVVPWRGPILLDMTAPDAVIAPGDRLAVTFGDMLITATLIEGRFGSYTGKWYGRAVGGMGGWKKTIPAKGYRSVAGLLSTQLFTDAALAAGELPPVVSVPQVLGEFYVRPEAPASQVFNLLTPGLDWWVSPEGITQVGARTNPIPAIAPIEILDAKINRGLYIVSTESPSAFVPGVSFLDPSSAALVKIELVSWLSTADKLRGEIWIA